MSVNERTFKKEVLEASTPVLVYFWAPWCSLCGAIEPVLKSFKVKWGKKIKLVDINADQSLLLASTYQLTTLPTIILFEGGRVRYRSEGCHHRDELHKTLQSQILQSIEQRQTVLSQAEYNTNSSCYR